ncbi:hypothetical protein [Nocardia goodfellowii]|uniref:Uncharacterized protein n=1 Tax=Nocardia goodfellowii TaxID=882446 RepID=A0ABS4QIS4_9NOCA|nr:hypothetical protein [Nocardia goodfellowii]MBP2191607.1 hypothetical protein [Nocardia goodfellowii]
MSAKYQFVVEGALSERVLAAFPELESATREATTALTGTVADSTAMRGVLARLDNLGLTLLEMRRLPE